jgi:2-methylisocitrate lyase-like PEP mutase family enzyme
MRPSRRDLCGGRHPVNADFEDGFARAGKVHANVARAVKTGIAGLSIEDFTGDNAKPLFDRALAVGASGGAQGDRADKSGVLLTGRCEAFLRGVKDESRDRPAHRLCRSRRRCSLFAGHLDQEKLPPS